MILSIPTTFVASTLIKSADMNGNLSSITNWANGNIQQDNLGTFAGPITWNVSSNVLCISTSSSSNIGQATFSQTGTLTSTSAIVSITSVAALTAGYGGLFVNLSSVSASVPGINATYAGTGPAIQANNSGTGNGLEINDTGTPASGKAALNVVSTTKASIPAPKMTTTQKNAISSPVDGMQVYDTTLGALQIYSAANSQWQYPNAAQIAAAGDILYGSAAGTITKLAGNTTTTPKLLGQTGTGSASAAPSWITQIGRPNLPTVGQQVSSSSGTYSNNSGFAAVTNLSVSITTTGRPVMLMLIPDGSANTAQFGMYSTTSGNPIGYYKFMRGSTSLGAVQISGSNVTSGVVDSCNVPLPVQIDFPSAGTYTYTLQTASANTMPFLTYYCELVAYEL